MMLFKFPTLQAGAHRIMLWGIERTWSQLGRWDYSPILWHFEKALHETTFDRDSTRIHPISSQSSFSAEVFGSLKKATSTLKKLYSRNVDLFCLAKLKGEGDSYFLEGICPSWIKLLEASGDSTQATLLSVTQGEWFSIPLKQGSSIFVVRADAHECPHQLEMVDPATCRYEALSEWIVSQSPTAMVFSSEDRGT